MEQKFDKHFFGLAKTTQTKLQLDKFRPAIIYKYFGEKEVIQLILEAFAFSIWQIHPDMRIQWKIKSQYLLLHSGPSCINCKLCQATKIQQNIKQYFHKLYTYSL